MARTANDSRRVGKNDDEIPRRTNVNPALPSLGKKSVPDRHSFVARNTGMSDRGFENQMGDLQRAAKRRLKGR